VINGIQFVGGLSIAGMLMVGSAAAQQGKETREDASHARAYSGAQDREPGAMATHHLVKASELMGKNIHNREGQKIGDVSELAIDLQSGKVQFALVSFGGFLGIGEKLVAVPFQLFQPGPKGEYLVLDVPKEKLEQAPKFDKDKWPDMNDEKWGREVTTFYGVEPYWTGTAQNRVDIGHGDMGGAQVADAAMLKQKFNAETLTTVTGTIVSVDRPLAGNFGRSDLNRGDVGRTGETGRTGEAGRTGRTGGETERGGMGRTGERTADQEHMGQDQHVVVLTLRTETVTGRTGLEKAKAGEHTGEQRGEQRTDKSALGGMGAGTVKVYLAPSSFLDNQHVALNANDQVTVTGSRVDLHGDSAIIATEIRKADQVVKLRDDTGNALWSGGQPATPPGGRK
jgi:sporulation protein YlmC with PRC-barrel domain